MSTATIIAPSDPNGGDEALGRVFSALADVEREGLSLISNNVVPGTAGLPSLVQYLTDGPVFTF